MNKVPSLKIKLITLLIVLIYIGLVVFSAWNGPSMLQDDHWYLNDVRTFLQTGKMQTNQIFPIMLAKGSYAPPPVLHNLPLMYPVLPFALLFGEYWGWIITNILFTLLSCLILVSIARRYGTEAWLQQALAAMYLFWTLTVHLSAHPLAEAGIVFSVLLLSYCWLFSPSGYLRQLLLGFLGAIVVLNRPSYLLLMLLLCILLLLNRDDKLLRRIGYLSVFLLSFLLFKTIGNLLLPQIETSFLEALKLPPGYAMLHFFKLQPLPFSLQVWFERLLYSLRLQLVGRSLSQTVLILIFDLLVIWYLIRALRQSSKPETALKLLCAMHLLVYAATLLLFHYQTRFLQMIFPFLLLWFIITLPAAGKAPIYRFIIAGICLIGLAGSIFSGWQNRRDALQTKELVRSYRQIEQKIHPEGAILADGNSMLLPYVFNRNPALLMFDDDVNTRADLLWMRAKVPYQWLICKTASTSLDSLSVLQPRLVSAFPAPMAEWGLYRLR